MADLVMIVTMVGFVLLFVAYVAWCDRIIVATSPVTRAVTTGPTTGRPTADEAPSPSGWRHDRRRRRQLVGLGLAVAGDRLPRRRAHLTRSASDVVAGRAPDRGAGRRCSAVTVPPLGRYIAAVYGSRARRLGTR